MKILFCIRNNYLTNIAGDSVQLITMEKYLENKGIIVDINSGMVKDYSKYDVIHLFNLTRISETYKYFKIAEKLSKRIVITPIYWDLAKYYTYTGSVEHQLLWLKYKTFRNEILNGCDMIYPSSIKEMELIKLEYGEFLPCTVVNNCIDYSWLKSSQSKINRGSFVFCAARICPRKNQIVLSKVCNELGVKLILAGESNNKDYL